MKKALSLILSVAVVLPILMVLIPVFAVTVPESGLVAFWDFEDDISNGAYDVIGEKNANITDGTPATKPVTQGNALYLDGASGLQTPYSEDLSFDNTESYTLSVWLNVDEQIGSGWRMIVGNGRSSQYTWNGIYYADGAIVMSISEDWRKSGYDTINATLGYVQRGTWNHVAIVYDAENGRAYGYLNGVLASDVACTYNTAVEGHGINFGWSEASSKEFFKGMLDNVRVYNTALSASDIASLNGAEINNFVADAEEGLEGFWNFEDSTDDGIFSDASGKNNNANIFGSATTKPVINGNNALYLDGDDSVRVPYSSAMSFDNTESYTLSMWINPDIDIPDGYRMIAGNGRSSGLKWNALYYVNGKVEISIAANPTYKSYDLGNAKPGQWNHVVLVYNAESGKIFGYMNGVKIVEAECALNTAHGSDHGFNMGWSDPSSPEYFKGQLDNVRVYSKALSASEIAVLNGEEALGFPPADGLEAYWNFEDGADDGFFTDVTGFGHDGEIVGATTKPVINGNNALYLDGNDNVKVPYSTKLAFTNKQSYTLSVWLNPDSDIPSGYRMICGNGRGSYDTWYALYYVNGTVELSVANGGTYISEKIGDVKPGQWNHVVLVFDASSERLYGYMNGIKTAEKACALDTASSSVGYGFTIGMSKEGADWEREYFKGQLDNIRVYSKALTSEEISVINNAEANGFSDRLEAYWDFEDGADDGFFTDASGNGNDGVIDGATTKPVINGNNALYLDGDDAVRVPYTTKLAFTNKQSYTLSVWLNADTDIPSGYRMICGNGRDSKFAWYALYYVNGEIQMSIFTSEASIGNSIGWVTPGQWNHIVLVFDAEAQMVYGYLNGEKTTEKACNIDTSAYVGHGFNMGWSQDGASWEKEYFKGQLDNVRVYSKALTASDIVALNGAEIGGFVCTHANAPEATCKEASVCPDCGVTVAPINSANHAGEANVYVDNGNGTHTVKYSCCGAEKETVDCVYGDDYVCDKCEYDNTVYVLAENANDMINDFFANGKITGDYIAAVGPAAGALDSFATVQNGTANGFTYAQFNLLFIDGKVALRHHFIITEEVTVTLNGEAVELKNDECPENVFYFDVELDVGEFDDAQVIAAGDAEITVSLYSYIKVALEEGVSADQETILRALYDVNEAA